MAHKNIINEVRVRVETEEKLKKQTEQLISSKKKNFKGFMKNLNKPESHC